LSAENSRETQKKFLESFIQYYDFTTVGRYTHEYHPFLFEKSSYSLDELEQNIESHGMSIKGRIVIAGYEEAAVPAYYTNYKVCTGSKINDEVRIKDASGWTQQLHNKFGVMTGFLFRDVPLITQYCLANQVEPLFEHINLHKMPIYDRDASLFQRHAFKDMFRVMLDEQSIIDLYMCQRNSKKIFSELVRFWRMLYEHELRFGSRQVLGTQDVLFSIAHAQHLYRSSVPLFKYYAGPDITYPIKVTLVQKEAATYHAQTFVKKFAQHLKKIDDKKTAYIFCSFVDGVGKSTLLGNVQNYQKYGSKFVDYDHVDNSSSQLAQLYKCGDGIFIADLPAQMSHFTYKPDGMVYFDPLAAGMSDKEFGDIVAYAFKNKTNLIESYEKLCAQVKRTVERSGWFAPGLSNPDAPEKAFVKNLLLLKREEQNVWIPFVYQGKHYLFHASNPESIRTLVKLELADSIGLKNYEPEQMLFFEGVRFPLPYSLFLGDLVGKLQERKIENVVFVDFLSMYPRSSRENIRINYLLQQLSLLYSDFSVEQSPYASFVNDAQLFYTLKKDKHKKILSAFQQESLVRLALYNIMNERKNDTVDGVSLDVISSLLSNKLHTIPEKLASQASVKAREKLDRETKQLERVHGKTKNFVNIQELDFDEVIELNHKLQKLFVHYAKNKRVRELWRDLDGDVSDSYGRLDGFVDKKITLSNGVQAQLLYLFSPESRNSMILAPVLRLLRTSWYLSLANVIGQPLRERYFVPPVWVKQTKDGKIAVLRRLFKKYEKNISSYVDRTVKITNLPNLVVPQWGEFERVPYLLNTYRARTDKGLFAFGCDLLDYSGYSWPGFTRAVSHLVKMYKEKEEPETVMPAAVLWKELLRDGWWERRYKWLIEQARKNTKEQKNNDKKERQKELPEDFSDQEPGQEEQEIDPKTRIRLGKKKEVKICRLIVRALATLEMVMKDATSDIAVRNGDKKDFVAALHMFEKIVLPTYFDIVFESNLFENYQAVTFLGL